MEMSKEARASIVEALVSLARENLPILWAEAREPIYHRLLDLADDRRFIGEATDEFADLLVGIYNYYDGIEDD